MDWIKYEVCLLLLLGYISTASSARIPSPTSTAIEQEYLKQGNTLENTPGPEEVDTSEIDASRGLLDILTSGKSNSHQNAYELYGVKNSEAMRHDFNSRIHLKKLNKNRQDALQRKQLKELFSHRARIPRSASTNGAESRFSEDSEYKSDTELISEYTGNYDAQKAVENHMRNFLVDMLKLFQYEIEEVAHESNKLSNKRRRHKRLREHKSRPKRDLRKRDLRTMFLDPEVQKIIMSYFNQRGADANGNPIFRYG